MDVLYLVIELNIPFLWLKTIGYNDFDLTNILI